MAMNPTALGAAIASALNVSDPTVLAHYTALARVIIAHIQMNAVVSTTIAVGTTANGVTGGGASVPVTGTTTGSIT